VADGALDFLGEGDTLTVTYTITVQDDSGAANDTSTTRDIVITITGTNDRPVAVADSNGEDTVVEAGVHPGNNPFDGNPTASGNVLTNDTDVDSGDTKTVVGVAAGDPESDVSGHVGSSVTGTYGSVQIDANGNWTYTLNNDDPDTNALAEGETV